jgi:hypothetical protein
MKLRIAILLLATASLFCSAASASTVTTNFTAGVTPGTNDKLSSPETFSLGASTITTTAGDYTYNPPTIPFSNSPVSLNPPGGNSNVVIVNDLPGYSGLGVCHSFCGDNGTGYNTSLIDVGNDANTHELLQINLGTAESAGYSSFGFASNNAVVDNGIEEEMGVYGTNNSGQLGVLLADIDDADGLVIVPLAQNYQYINIISDVATGDANDGNGNVLLNEVVATTPLPGTLPLMATVLGGLTMLGWYRKRNRHSESAAI